MSNRNTAIDAMRFVFILILCPFHCPAVNPFPNGYIAVEFFFILAGFFIYLSYRKHNDIGTIDFTLKKAKRFFWPLIISLLLLVLIDRKKYIYPHDLTPDGIVSQYFAHIPEFLFCQGLHLIDVDFYINVALWFVSILLFGGAIIFSLLRNIGHKAIAIIFPLITLFGVTYLKSFGDCGLVWRSQLSGSPIDCSLIRGLAEMSLGVLLAYIYEQKYTILDRYRHCVSVMGLTGLIGMILIACSHNNYDTLSLFLIPMIILACMHPKTLFTIILRDKIWAQFGGMSMHMFFIHTFVATLYYIIASRISLMEELPLVISLVGYLFCVFLAGAALQIISDKLYKRTFNK